MKSKILKMASIRVRNKLGILALIFCYINLTTSQNATIENDINKSVTNKSVLKLNTEIIQDNLVSEIQDESGTLKVKIESEDTSVKKDDERIIMIGDDPVIKQLMTFHGDSNEKFDAETTMKMTWLVQLFDQHKWNPEHYQNASGDCRKDLMTYLDGLRRNYEWAEKMWDASGRYNGQFFFGNDFWLGSSGLCEELGVERSSGNATFHKGPPFDAGFNVARIVLSTGNSTNQVRTILMGQCMPSSCTPQDLELVLRAGAREALEKMEEGEGGFQGRRDPGVRLVVELVRPVPGDYDMWKDAKFHVMLGVGSAAVFLMFVASCYEMYVNRCNDQTKANGKDLEGDHSNNNNSPNGIASNSGYINGGHSANGGQSNSAGHSSNGGHCANGNGFTPNGDVDSTNCERKAGTGVLSQILLAFSAISNTEKIMKTEESSEDSISCIHGLRFLSLAWVIMVHTYLQAFAVADNKMLRVIIERNFLYQTVGNASYSVDTFFFISGLLVTFLYYKSMDNKKIALAKRHAKNAAKNSSTQSRTENYSNGQKIQMHQYAYSNPAMVPHSTSMIGQPISTQPIVGLEEFQHTNPMFIRQTCPKEVKDNTFEFLELLFYRIVRLTPAYLFAIGINELALKYSHNNSVFEPMILDHITCDKYWWRNILYINNLYPRAEMCMLWSWYMANDTQFYVIGIILLLISKRYFKISAIALFVLLVLSWITTAYISLANDYRAKIQEPFEMFDQLYDKPWSRLGPYLVGMVTGWCLWKVRGRVVLPLWAAILGWPGALAICVSLVYGMKDGYLELWPTAFYVSIGHTAWGVALAWVVLWCVSRRNGLLARLLGYRGILPLSRLAYCAYLVHPTIMMLSTFQMDGPVHLHNGIVLIIYAGNAVMSYLMSFAISLAFEAPAVRLLKINYLRRPKNKSV